MDIIKDITAARDKINQYKKANKTVALVATMGNLHAGHLSLVKQAQENADLVVVSIFVNPMQFGINEDFSTYPRTFENDISQLNKLNIAMVFAPNMDDIYPDGTSNSTKVTVPKVSDILCGEFRPGFFTGVASIVCKLFNILPVDFAVFGKKDFQQLHIIKRMVADLNIPIKILEGKTIREPDGLALSSRNQYLSTAERSVAVKIYATLVAAKEKLQAGVSISQIQNEAIESLKDFDVDYFLVRDYNSLGELVNIDEAIILTEVKLGGTRLIDNI